MAAVSSLSIVAKYSASNQSVDLAIDPLLTCKLCLSEWSLKDMYEIQECKCLFCEVCMGLYVSVMVQEGNVTAITCPDAQCRKQGTLRVDEIEKLVDSSTFERYHRLKFQREVELDPNRTFCPEAGCETICHVCTAPSGDSLQPKPVYCPTCGLQFCSICKCTWHASLTCDEFLRSGAHKQDHDGFMIPFSNSEEAQIKRCPLCHVPIERHEGCAQMMCRRCKHIFCWYCLASLDDDFLLRHYDRGPCKNKLGHSRASVIFHRVQVVGIFASFGILLVVASPFLLLAAPCILCCKCKSCKKCCDEDEGDPLGST